MLSLLMSIIFLYLQKYLISTVFLLFFAFGRLYKSYWNKKHIIYYFLGDDNYKNYKIRRNIKEKISNLIFNIIIDILIILNPIVCKIFLILSIFFTISSFIVNIYFENQLEELNCTKEEQKEILAKLKKANKNK